MHFTVLVTGDYPTDEMAPFDENLEGSESLDPMYYGHSKAGIEYRNGKSADDLIADVLENKDLIDPDEIHCYNAAGQWDWWVIGGRWANYWLLKKGRPGDHGQPGVFEDDIEELRHEDGSLKRCDIAEKGDIDFDGMRNEAGLRAQNMFELMEGIFGEEPPVKSWSEIGSDMGVDEKVAKDVYNNQPRVILWEEYKRENPESGRMYDPFIDLTDFNGDKQDYIEDARDRAIVTHSLIKDKIWYSKYSFVNEKDWIKFFNDHLDSIGDEEQLCLIDAHQ